MRASPWCGILLATLAPGRMALAQPPEPAEAGAHASPVRLVVYPAALRARFSHLGGGGVASPPNPAGTVDVGQQARVAYAAALHSLFDGGGADAGLALEIVDARADVDWDADGWHAVVEHVLAARRADGGELGRWTVRGRAPMAPLGEKAMPRAFQEAARRAASQLEARFSEPPAVAAWLREHHLEPRAPPAASIPEPSSSPPLLRPPAGPPRAAYGLYADAGGGFTSYRATRDFHVVPSRTHSTSEDGEPVGTWAGRLGATGRWMFAQVAFGGWHSGHDRLDDESYAVSMVGLDVGPVIRFFRQLELAAGIGAHQMRARLGFDSGFPERRRTLRESGTVGSAHLALRFVSVEARRVAVRAGVELRHHVGATLEFTTRDEPLLKETREITARNTLGVHVGVELPLRRR